MPPLWHFSSRRSALRQANDRLSRDRAIRGARWAAARARASLVQGDWRQPVISSVLLTIPLLWHVGASPRSWLAGAWQISAVLVGLVVALIIFLLQAASAQSVTAERTYRTLIASTFLVWPVSLALLFVAWVAVLTRYGDNGTAPPPWVDSWALGLFLLQTLMFGVVFVRLLRLVAPEGLARVVEDAFADAIQRSVEAKLRNQIMQELIKARCEKAGLEVEEYPEVAVRVERDLPTVHVKPGYDRHQGLL